MTLAATQYPISLVPFCGAVPTGSITTSIGSSDAFTFNAAGDSIAWVFQAPTTDVPDLVSFSVVAVTVAGTAGDIEATLQTVDSDGLPSGTPVTNSATGTATISTTGIKNISGMDGTATIVRGTLYAIVLTAGAGWDRTLTINRTTGSAQGGLGLPYSLTKDTAGAWTRNSATNMGYCVGLATAGGAYINIMGLSGAYTASYQTFDNATNPDERGNRFTLAVPATLTGVLLAMNAGAGPDSTDAYTVSLYSSHTATPVQLKTKAMEAAAQGAHSPKLVLFDAAVDLAADTVYAITLKSTSTGDILLARWEFQANADLEGFISATFHSTTRDGGAGEPGSGGNNFTDDDTMVYAVFPIFSKFDDGAGGAGGGGPLVITGI